jgi:LacI family transcriptional regulator
MKNGDKRGSTKKISVRDVAAAAGVSIGSVSRVLNGRTYVSVDLSARVLRAVEQLGYHPDAHARGLRMGVSKTIGCLIPDISNPLYAAFVSAVEARLQEDGYMLLLGSTRSLASRERELVKLFESRGMDGIIANTVNDGDGESAEVFNKCALPVVVLDRDIGPGFDTIQFDHRSGIRRAIEYLFALGHERIVLLTPGMHIRPGRERVAAYKEAYKAAGRKVESDLIRAINPRLSMAYDDVKRLLSQPNRPTAIIGLSTHILAGATRAIHDSGLSIPKDISVIAIGTQESVGFAHPAMTLVRLDVDATARGAVELLLDRLHHRDSEYRHITQPVELVIAGSCGRRKSSKL